MANSLLQYGPYNSRSDSKREYEAKDIGRMFDGIVTDGVFPYIGTQFKITKDSGLKIKVGTGKAWFNHTWNYLDSPMIFKLENGDPIYSRYDAVIMRIGCSELVRENKILVKTGVASEDPKPPELEIDEDSQYEYVLGYIKVDQNINELPDNSVITNLVGQDSDPKGFYLPGEFAEFAYAVGDNHIGYKIVEIPYNEETSEMDWIEKIGSDELKYYYREMPITGIANNSILSYDIWTDGDNIGSIQKQEANFTLLFRVTVQDNILKLWSYRRPEVSYRIRFVGKGVSNA